MAVSSMLPNTTTVGGITPVPHGLPEIQAVTGGDVNYNARMAAATALMQAGNGIAGGGFRRRRNNVTKVMKGCSNKKTRRNNKNKGHSNRLFRGGANITPAITGGKLELTMPGGSSDTQVDALKTLTGGLLDLQTAAGNLPPDMPKPVVGMFSGGGRTRKRMNKHRRTKYRRLRYKKSIGRRGRSRRHSGRH